MHSKVKAMTIFLVSCCNLAPVWQHSPEPIANDLNQGESSVIGTAKLTIVDEFLMRYQSCICFNQAAFPWKRTNSQLMKAPCFGARWTQSWV